MIKLFKGIVTLMDFFLGMGLVLMDDTVLLAMTSTRDNMVHKMSLMKQIFADYRMRLNACKTKFFVICSTEQDREERR